MNNKIVVVDDEKISLELLEHVLSNPNYQVFPFGDPKKALAYCQANEFDLIVADQKMPGLPGLQLIKEIRQKKTDFHAIILSAYTDSEFLMDAVNSGVLYQYLVKPTDAEVLNETIDKALRDLRRRRTDAVEGQQTREELNQLRQENTELKFLAASPLDAIVGTNPVLKKVKEQIKSFSLSDHPVLISGEEGTGKKLVAQAVHALSSRRSQPFMSLYCDNVPEELLEAEIFGAAKGGLPGLKNEKSGFLEAAHQGTLLLHDIQLLGKTLQGKLLRFIQYGTYYPVGSTVEKAADVRLLLTAKSNLMKEVQDGGIRKDFYYKINTLHIKMPPLRERRDDILPLIAALAQKSGKSMPKFAAEVQDQLVRYAYPGNIRELEGILEKLALAAQANPEGEANELDMDRILQENIKTYAQVQGDRAVVRTVHLPTGKEPIHMRRFIDSIECDIIENCLKHNDFNISQTSRMLVISRQGLKNKIKRYGLEDKYHLTGDEEGPDDELGDDEEIAGDDE